MRRLPFALSHAATENPRRVLSPGSSATRRTATASSSERDFPVPATHAKQTQGLQSKHGRIAMGTGRETTFWDLVCRLHSLSITDGAITISGAVMGPSRMRHTIGNLFLLPPIISQIAEETSTDFCFGARHTPARRHGKDTGDSRARRDSNHFAGRARGWPPRGP